MSDTFRKEYTPLNDEQKNHVTQIKSYAEELLNKFNAAVPSEERSERARCMNLARTKLEEAVMWAVKGVTTKDETV